MDNNTVIVVAQKAWALLAKEDIRAQLVGTAGLLFHGFDYLPHDVDFLCESMPDAGETLPPDPQYKDGETSREMTIDGIDVNFILAGDARAPFLAPAPPILHGVPVAPLEYILNLKRRADREKDRQFFLDHPEMGI